MVERAIPYAIQRHFGYTPTTERVREELALEGARWRPRPSAADAPSEADVRRRRDAGRSALLADNGWDAVVVVGQENGQHLTGWDIEITRYWPDRPLVVVATPDETVLVVWARDDQDGQAARTVRRPASSGYSRGGDGPGRRARRSLQVLREPGVDDGAGRAREVARARELPAS